MAKVETKSWELERISKFEVRITPKKLYIDRINLETGVSQIAMYVQVQEYWNGGVDKKYFTSMPTSNYCNTDINLESIIEFIRDRFDINITQDAIDLFESRNVMRTFTKNE